MFDVPYEKMVCDSDLGDGGLFFYNEYMEWVLRNSNSGFKIYYKDIQDVKIIYTRKNKLTPITEIKAPTTAFHVIFSWKSQYDGKRMMIGVIAISVEAMPAAVYCTAINEKPTPTKGPKMVVAVATESPFLSCIASRKSPISSR